MKSNLDYQTRSIVEYVIKLLEEKDINPVKIIKDEDEYVNVYVKDAVFTPELCEEAWFKAQQEFNTKFPRVLVDSDLFCWLSSYSQDLSKHFLELEIDLKPIDKTAKLFTIEEVSSSINHLISTESKKTNTGRTNDASSFHWSCKTQCFPKFKVNSKLLTETTKIEISDKKSRGYIQAQNDQSDYSENQSVA